MQKNPWTGEIWTVYEHGVGSDTITYCPPTSEVGCKEASFVGGAPPPDPPAAYVPSTSTVTVTTQ